MQEQVMGTSTAAIHSTDLSLSSTENVFQNVQELNKSSQITLEAFQQQLHFIGDLQQQTLEDVSMVHSEVTDILNQSIREMEDFHSPFTTEMTSTPKEENKNSSITRREYASLSMTDNISDKVKGEKKQYATTEEKDYPDNPSFHEAGNFPWMVTSEKLSTTKSREHHSDAGQTSPRNVAVQQYSNPQYAEPDDSNSEDTFYCLERDGDGENSRKQNLLAQQANDATKDLSTLGLSDLTSNVNESSLLHDATEMIHDSKHVEPWKRDLLYSDGKERGRMPEEIVDNKHAIHQENLEIHKLKSFLDREDQMNIPDQRTDYESKALRKSLKQLHENARYLRIENLQCRQQITRLTADKNILQLQLSKAEQDAEVYLQQVKVLTEKCEALLNQRQHVQDEGKYLSIDKHSLMKDVEDMRMENKKQLIELLMATAEKEELLKKLDSSKKMLMSCSREKEELHGQLTEALVENCQLWRKVHDSSSLYLKVGEIMTGDNQFPNHLQQSRPLTGHFKPNIGMRLNSSRVYQNSLYYKEEKTNGRTEEQKSKYMSYYCTSGENRPEWQSMTSALLHHHRDNAISVQRESESFFPKNVEYNKKLNSERSPLGTSMETTLKTQTHSLKWVNSQKGDNLFNSYNSRNSVFNEVTMNDLQKRNCHSYCGMLKEMSNFQYKENTVAFEGGARHNSKAEGYGVWKAFDSHYQE